MWIFRVKRPPGSPPVFKARYVARGFSQRQGVDFFQTFSPTPKMTTLQVLLHVAAHRDYELHSLDFSTAFLQGSLHEDIWLRRPPGFTGSFPAGTQWSLRRPVYGLRQAPREWHDTLRTTLATLGFAPSTADPSLFLRIDTTLPPYYVLVYVDDLVFATADTEALAHVKAQRTITLTQSHMVQQVLQRFGFTYSSPQSTPLPTGHSLSAPPSHESVEPSGPYPELVGCLITSGMGLVLGGRARVVLTGHADASWVDDLATQRSSQGYTFSLGSGSVSWWSTRSSSVLSSSCEAEIYAGAMAAQELRWLTYLLTDLGEAPRSPPVLYVDIKAMLALCQEHRLEHRKKHITLRYFLARELQQRGQLRLAYVASQTNTTYVFTKALQPCDHQPCFAFLDWSCDLLFSPTLPMGIAMDAEMASCKSTSTYVDEVPPPGANIVNGMWIFRREGVDFFQTLSPTPKMTILRMSLHVAAHRDYELHSLNFSTAFLKGSLNEAIWLRCPRGFTGLFPEGSQWSLRRPVYGLRQAPRKWHNTPRTTLVALGFAPSTADPSLFLRTDTSLQPFYVLVYVDDFVLASADTEALALVKAELQERHTCTDLEPSGLYPELVGCLMYLMTCTRPDLAYPLIRLARYVAPGRYRKMHWDNAKRVLCYLCSTSGMGLVLGGLGSVVLTGHSSASWADDQTTHRLTQGYSFNLGTGSVSWRSTRSSSVISSSY
ncbi:unnamed protein product [Closterium sp. NIES-53]